MPWIRCPQSHCCHSFFLDSTTPEGVQCPACHFSFGNDLTESHSATEDLKACPPGLADTLSNLIPPTAPILPDGTGAIDGSDQTATLDQNLLDHEITLDWNSRRVTSSEMNQASDSATLEIKNCNHTPVKLPLNDITLALDQNQRLETLFPKTETDVSIPTRLLGDNLAGTLPLPALPVDNQQTLEMAEAAEKTRANGLYDNQSQPCIDPTLDYPGNHSSSPVTLEFPDTALNPENEIDPDKTQLMDSLASTSVIDQNEPSTQPLAPAVSGPDQSASRKKSSTHSLKTRGEKIGRFEILRFVGEGGFGRVYEAHDPQLDRRIALKVAKSELMQDDRRIASFVQEARAAGNLRHPHIIGVFDSGQDGSHYFIASAFIEGQSLDRHLRELPEGQRLPLRQTAEIIRQIAEALAYAHGHGVVHRDVKPGNIMLDENQLPLLMDFGLAARQENSTSESNPNKRVGGTPAYMAPEQSRGEPVAASDQYSLGCTLFELLTGQTLFAGPPEIQQFLHQSQPPPRPRKVNSRVPLDLEAICLRCLAKNPEDRFASCQELADDLRRWMDGEPTRSLRLNPIERGVSWARRKPFQAGFAIASISLVALGFLAAWQRADLAESKYKDFVLKEKARRQAEEDQRTLETQHLKAQEYIAKSLWQEAREQLVSVLNTLELKPDLKLEELKNKVRDHLKEVDDRIKQIRDIAEAKTLLNSNFRKPYDAAVYSMVPLIGEGTPQTREQTRTHIRNALSLYCDTTENKPSITLIKKLKTEQTLLEPTDFNKLMTSCYELFLSWADLEAREHAGTPEAKKSAEQALSLLEEASHLGDEFGFKTRILSIRKSRYQALARGEKESSLPLESAPSQPTGALDWFLSGLERFQRDKNFGEAAKDLQQVLQLDDKNYWAHYLLALCRLRSGEWHAARAELTLCLNQNPAFLWPLILRGFAAGEQGVPSMELEKQAKLQHGIDSPEALKYHLAWEADFAAAHSDLNQALAGNLENEARYVALTNRAVLFNREGRYILAMKDLQKAIDLFPGMFQAHVNLAKCLQDQGKGQEALTELAKAIRCDPNRPELYTMRAQICLDQNDRSNAKASLDQAIAHEPKEPNRRRLVENLVRRSDLLSKEGKPADALRDADLALKIDPTFRLAERFRAQAFRGLKQPDKEAESLDAYLNTTTVPVVEALEARGLLFAQAGQPAEAIEVYSAALRRKSTNEFLIRGQRAWAYLQIGAPRLAEEDFTTCLKTNPKKADYLAGRASARMRLGKLKEALVDAEAADEEGDLSERSLYHLCCVHALASSQIAYKNDNPLQGKASQNQHEKMALRLLERSLSKLTSDKKVQFWRDQVEADPSLASLRNLPEFKKMDRYYGTPGDRRSQKVQK